MSKFYIPTNGPDDWKSFLADPKNQWRSGFSAKTLAYCWEKSNGLPNEITSMLAPLGGGVELLVALPEHKVKLDNLPRGESQNDVFALARIGERIFAITIEGKVREPFGQRLGDWLHNPSPARRDRLGLICTRLGLTLPLPEDVYYQLLHRSASAVIEAERFKTDAAAMIVHSFSPERVGFDAFAKFASLFGATAVPNELICVRPNGKPPLYIGWACGDCQFLTA